MRHLLASLALLISSALSHALTMEFTGIPNEWHPDFPEVYEEGGIFFRGSGHSQSGFGGDSVYLNPKASSISGSGRFFTGGLFRADSMAFRGYSLDAEYVMWNWDHGPLYYAQFPYKALSIQGYLDGELVAETFIDVNAHMSSEDINARGFPTFYFGDEYAVLDLLWVSVLDPFDRRAPEETQIRAQLEAQYPELYVGINGCGDNEYCASVTIDSITLTPVPIPAGVWLLGSALGLLGFMRRRCLVRTQA